MPQTSLPDFHFLLIASNLGAEWFFEAAHAYWVQFRPTVISDLALVSVVPEDASVAVTVLARRDRVSQLGVELAKINAGALFDPLVFDFMEDAQKALDQRAQSNQPFGVPLIPTETPTPGPTSAPVYPTPGPISPSNPNVPPTATPGLPDQASIDTNAPPQTPVFPTPGPISGN